MNVWIGAVLVLLALGAWSAEEPVTCSWLGDQAPEIATGVAWGVPWARGRMPADAPLEVRDATGRVVPAQVWPLATWPDGSRKWSGFAIAGDPALRLPFSIGPGPGATPPAPVTVTSEVTGITVATGRFTCRIPQRGGFLFSSLQLAGRELAGNGRLIVRREDRSAYASEGILREETAASEVTAVTVEQAGPVRAVIRLDGMHAVGRDGRRWLPFTVRLYVTAGIESLRLMHTFVFDGDAERDFIRGLGISCDVPLREELQNRYVRFATADDGSWGEPVILAPGHRERLVPDAIRLEQDQLAGRRIPDLATMPAAVADHFRSLARWDGFKLVQTEADAFAISKRTGSDVSWVRAGHGQRAPGTVFLGDASGGLVCGLRDFWRRHPTALAIDGMTTARATLTTWLWSPDAPAMDLRHYATSGHGLDIAYEDIEPGSSTPAGVANTHELVFEILDRPPTAAELTARGRQVAAPPALVCTPAHYHASGTLGTWSLPDTQLPVRAAAETQLARALRFYADEIEQRRWYGFWDYGDVMRTYDNRRHAWLYDVGGHAWNNTELMPNVWLWLSFLRTGDPVAYRLAEAMTRNTGEVDVYHAGRFAGLGSRHNVSHWGCGAKEVRISQAYLNRYLHYLAADERTGDLMQEVVTADQALIATQPLRKILTRPDLPLLRAGPDWVALASNWLVAWERTGDPRSRAKLLAGMDSIGAMPEAFTKHAAFGYEASTGRLIAIGEPNLPAHEFAVLFAGDQVAMELIQVTGHKPFAAAWLALMQTLIRKGQQPSVYAAMRMTAYVARETADPVLRAKAWALFAASLQRGNEDYIPAQPTRIRGPEVPAPTSEIPGTCTFGPSIATPEIAQWAINLITTSELLRDLPP